ncbi:MAG: hypothetical protein JXB10_11755 [Pirellulales bacterium]|nr:hypothetical protein [Pirellulales bacterium]
MSEEKKPSLAEHETDAEEPSNSEGKKTFQFFKGKWFFQTVVGLIVLSVVVQAGGWLYYYLTSPNQAQQGPEIGLGQYQFRDAPPAGGRITKAQFALHVTLLKGLEKSGREALADHKYRVQQDVEQLLRTVHSGDFEDPALDGLKLQIREKVDKAVGTRVVSDVIITDLKLTLASPPDHPPVADHTTIPVTPVPLETGHIN